MSRIRRTWLTQAAYDRLSRELDELRADGAEPVDPEFPHLSGGDAKQARIERLQELLQDAVVGEPPPDDGIAEPGMVLTVRYEGDDEPETFLLGVRDGSAEEGLTVYSPESPLGTAIIGAGQGEERSFTAPGGRTVRVVLLSAHPYGAHEERLVS